MHIPEFTLAEKESRDTFMALLDATSRPGSIQTLSFGTYPQNFYAIANTLIDLETTFYAHDDVLAMKMRRGGARQTAVDKASYLLFPSIDNESVELIKDAGVGTMLYPDQGASLFIGCRLNTGDKLLLSGPGIQESTEVQIGDIPRSFWALREEIIAYPLGWEIYFVDGDQVLAIPRSTKVIVASN